MLNHSMRGLFGRVSRPLAFVCAAAVFAFTMLVPSTAQSETSSGIHSPPSLVVPALVEASFSPAAATAGPTENDLDCAAKLWDGLVSPAAEAFSCHSYSKLVADKCCSTVDPTTCCGVWCHD